MGETLFEYHQRINREAQQRARERRETFGRWRRRLRTEERIRQLEAEERSRRVDQALDDVWKQWTKTREVIENCTAVTPEVRTAWRQRLDSIQYVSNRSNPAKLEDMASDVRSIAGDLAGIYDDLVAASKRREVPSGWMALPSRRVRTPAPTLTLPDVVPWDPTRLQTLSTGFQPIARGFRPIARRAPTVAEDLQPIHDRIRGAANVPLEVRRTWIDQLEQIDKSAAPWDLSGLSSAQKAMHLADLIKATEWEIDSVAHALSDQATACRRFWDL